MKKILLKNLFKKYLFLIIIIISLIIIFYFFINKYNKNIENFDNNDENEFIKFIDNHSFYNEKNEKINHKVEEIDEQRQAFKYITSNDIVLELGGRYGSVSVVINKIVNNKNQHVVVDPDLNIIPALQKNRDLNNCSFTILPKFISNKNKKIVYNGYGTRVEDNIESITDNNESQISYNKFKEEFPQNFNVLVADCEGCLYEFLEMMGNDFNNLTKVIYEADQPDICDYVKVKEKLINAGFIMKDNNSDFRFVYVKESI